MVEEILNHISHLPPISIYISVFLIAYIENIFPPSPSDLLIAVAGSLLSTGDIKWGFLLTSAVFGSTLGFLTMYFIGRFFGKTVVDSGKIKFINKESIDKFERWFIKYENWLIIGNRFLAGTRAVIAFCIGMSKVELKRTIILSFISSLLWNSILIYLGYLVGDNASLIDQYLSSYNKVIIIIIVLFSLYFLIKYLFKKIKNKR